MAVRESDQYMLQVSRELGGLAEAVHQGTKDREAIWKELKENSEQTRHDVAAMTNAVSELTHMMKSLPTMNISLAAVTKRVDDMEDTDKSRRNKIIGISLGAGLGGGAGFPAMFDWLRHLIH